MLRTIASKFIRHPFAKRTPFFKFSENNDKKDQNIQTTSPIEEIKASQALTKSIGMNQFLMRVYNTTGLSILGAIGSSFLFMSMPLVMANLDAFSILGGLLTLTCIPLASYMKPNKVVENINGKEVYKTTNSIARRAVYSTGVLGMGLASTQLFLMAQAVSPSIIPIAFGITTAIFGGASLMAYSMPRDKMLGYGRILGGSLLGLLGLQIAGLLAYVVMGPNPYS